MPRHVTYSLKIKNKFSINCTASFLLLCLNKALDSTVKEGEGDRKNDHQSKRGYGVRAGQAAYSPHALYTGTPMSTPSAIYEEQEQDPGHREAGNLTHAASGGTRAVCNQGLSYTVKRNQGDSNFMFTG